MKSSAICEQRRPNRVAEAGALGGARLGWAVGVAMLTVVGAIGCYSRGTDHTVDELPQAGDRPPPQHAYGTTIHMPFHALGASTPDRTVDGSRARVPCATCHADDETAAQQPIDQRSDYVHTGIALRHGSLACDSCHRPPAYADFRSARATPIEYAQAIDLCSQCHGAQRRDYDHGAHGGMAGYWDLDQGSRDRNHCLVCHDPHSPAIAKVAPAPLPRYRFTHTRQERTRE